MAIRDIYQERQFTIMGVFALTAILFLFKAVQLQLLDTSYQDKARATTIEKNTLYPSRGVIYDRNSELLVYNNALYDLMVTYKQIDKKMDTLKFCRLLGIDTMQFKANLSKDFKSGKFSKSIPFAFMTMVPPDVYARFQEHGFEFPGFFAQIRNVRGFPQHNGAHVLGYLNEVNDKQVKKNPDIYDPGDYIGATGLEKQYEETLRGKKGFQYILKDALGRMVGPYKEGKLDSGAIAGKDMLTGLDIKLQALAEKCLTGKIGAVVAIEPSSGEILAMCSSPTYDPNAMTISKNRGDVIRQMLKDTLKPLFDRTVTAEYPPGSIFKPMLGLIAQQAGVWDWHNGMGCAGGFHYGRLTVKCHSHPSSASLIDAVEHSCNNYFCTVLRSVVDKYGWRNAKQGLDSLTLALNRFGMGTTLGVDYPGEKDGNVPNSPYYDKIYPKSKGSWYSTTIVSIGIGQGENQLTTIQMANLAATIANRGYFYTPHLLKGFKDKTPIPVKFRTKHFAGVDNKYYLPVVTGMRAVVESGTGSGARVANVAVCGKTGTSQNPHGADSSVFIAFAPEESPKIALAVYIENGGFGNDFAAPISGLMIEQFLNGKVADSRKPLIERMAKSKLAYSAGKGYYVQKASY